MAIEDDSLFRVLIQTAVDGIVVIGRDGIVRFYNDACERLFGYRAAEVVGCNVRMLMPEPFRGEHDGYLANYHATGAKRIIGVGREVMGQRKDGSTFPLYLSVGEGVSHGEQIFVAIIHDLTEIKSEIARRQGADSLLAQIVASSDDAILSKTLDGVIMSWNGAAERIFGYAAAEAIGAPVTLIIPPERLAEEENILRQLRSGRAIRHFETVRRHKDGTEVQVSISVSPVYDAAGAIVGASKIARDISERKQSEAHLHQLQSELAHVARLSSMSQMSSALAHELNQPLTAISNYVKAARRTLEAPGGVVVARATDAIDKAAAQVQRAGAIIRNLRDFAEKRESSRAPHDINTVIEEAMTLGLIGIGRHDVVIRLDLDRTLPSVLIEKVQIQQVLINLFRNAIEAMQGLQKRELFIATGRDAGFAAVIVRDSGPGLPEEVRKRLFQPFTTTKEKGMGIGLSICQSIVEAHGGDIVSLPSAASGAAFKFRVPFAGQREAA